MQAVRGGYDTRLELGASAAGRGASLRYPSTASTTCCTTSYIPWKKPMACWVVLAGQSGCVTRLPRLREISWPC